MVLYYYGDKNIGNKGKLVPQYKGPYEIIKIEENQITFTIKKVDDDTETLKVHGSKLAKYNKN